MARPKRNEGIPPAKERIQQAFWNQLEHGCYSEITVASIVGEAKVNRNTFYYHYQSIPHLAEEAAAATFLNPQFAAAIMSHIHSAHDASSALFSIPDMGIRSFRASLIASSHSSEELRSFLKDRIRGLWLAAFGIDAGRLAAPDYVAIEHALGGIVALLAARVDNPDAFELEDIAASGVPTQVFGMLKRIAREQLVPLN